MAITIHTTHYEFAYGKKPKGRGRWAFVHQASHRMGSDYLMFAPPGVTFREACAWARKAVRDRGFQDATVQVGA